MPAAVVLCSQDQHVRNRCWCCKCGQDNWLLEGGSRRHRVLGLSIFSLQVHTADSYCIKHWKGPGKKRAIHREKLWRCWQGNFPLSGLRLGLNRDEKWRLVTLGFWWRSFIWGAIFWDSKKEYSFWQPIIGSCWLRVILCWLSLYRADSPSFLLEARKRFRRDACSSYLRNFAIGRLPVGQFPLHRRVFCNTTRHFRPVYRNCKDVPGNKIQKLNFSCFLRRNVVFMALHAHYSATDVHLGSWVIHFTRPGNPWSVTILRAVLA